MSEDTDTDIDDALAGPDPECEHPTGAYETSLSKLSDSEWHQISNRWARGIDWNVQKFGRKWAIMGEHFQAFPFFRTKRAAGDALDKLILAESHYRQERGAR